MYGILLATLLTADNAVMGADIYEDVQELRKSVQELRKQESQARIDDLQQTIARLRERLVEEKLDELRRDIRALRYEGTVYTDGPRVWPAPMPMMPRSQSQTQRAVISLQVPPGAEVSVNDRELSLPSVNPSFVSPPLESGRDYFYDFKIKLMQDNKMVIRTKRLTVRSGMVVRLNFEDMEVLH
jgi:uncharacterized protein (TIGR03000 family)